MHAQELYRKLENDFITAKMTDEWATYMDDVKCYLSENFIARSMGVVCDFASDITCVYTAVFPSHDVMKKIIDDGVSDALLFVHHPSIWDVRRDPVFFQMDKAQLEIFKERRIAIYNLHTPLDNNGPYATSVTLAHAIGVSYDEDFAPYSGVLGGVLGISKSKTVGAFKDVIEKSVGHEIVVYKNGEECIDAPVAVAAGGALIKEIIEEAYKKGARNFVTGLTAQTKYQQDAHDFARDHHINVYGLTHYSSESFSCKEMCKYFGACNLPVVFIPDVPLMEDMGKII